MDSKKKEYRELLKKAAGCIEQGDCGGAITLLEQAEALSPGDAAVLNSLAGLHFQMRNMEKARHYWEAAVQADPQSPYARDAMTSLGFLSMAEPND